MAGICRRRWMHAQDPVFGTRRPDSLPRSMWVHLAARSSSWAGNCGVAGLLSLVSFAYAVAPVNRTLVWVSETLHFADVAVPAHVRSELEELRAENARLLRLLKLTRGGAAPPGPAQAGLLMHRRARYIPARLPRSGWRC